MDFAGKKTYIVCRREGRILSFLLDEEGKTEQIRAEYPHQEHQGNLYLARITKLAPGQNAAFIDYAPGKSGYLQLETCMDAVVTHKGNGAQLRPGDELIVSMQRMRVGSKLPVFSGAVELAGTYLIVRLGEGSVRISRKIDASIRRIWLEIAGKWQMENPDVQIIIRTNAQFASQQVVSEEAAALIAEIRKLCKRALHSSCPCTLHQQNEKWLTELSSLPVADVGRIVLEDADLFQAAEQFLISKNSPLLPLLMHYQDPLLRLESLYSLETRLNEAMDKKVWLRSGGFLVIEQTEALVSIDVNAGKSTIGRTAETKEAQALKINLEAALEITRQLRLRNLGGIIVVDFINMHQKAHRHQVLSVLKDGLANDRMPCSAPEFTSLGLAEFTRKKQEESLMQMLSE